MCRSGRLPLLVLATVLVAGAASSSAQEYQAHASLRFTYSDQDITSVPTAHVEGDTSPGTSWIRYDVTAGPGALQTGHDLYSCCVSNASATASFRLDDVVFASPGGGGGTADVTFNFAASATANLDGQNLTVQASLAGVTLTQGVWIAGPTASTGVFTGYDSQSLAGDFTSTVFTVPLDVPLQFFLSTAGGTGSYQVVSSVDSYVTLPLPGSGLPVFNIVSGPAGITASSAQGGIVDNAWNGGGVVAVEGHSPARTDLLLGRPAPNPSRGAVSFALSLPEEARISLRVYDLRGALVQRVEDGVLAAGHHRLAWNPAAGVPAGTYFVRLDALGEQRTQRVVVLR